MNKLKYVLALAVMVALPASADKYTDARSRRDDWVLAQIDLNFKGFKQVPSFSSSCPVGMIIDANQGDEFDLLLQDRGFSVTYKDRVSHVVWYDFDQMRYIKASPKIKRLLEKVMAEDMKEIDDQKVSPNVRRAE